MKISIAKRRKEPIKMAFQGPSGSGKTYSSLLTAYGLCKDWSKIAVLDTQHRSSELYAHLGNYSIVDIGDPFEPEKYAECILGCEKAGFKALILDSFSDEWEYLLDFLSTLSGSSYSGWNKILPRHSNLLQCILNSSCHIICTVRTKQDYVIADKNGEKVPEKVGLKAVQKDAYETDFPLVFDLDMKHHALVNKDATGLFETGLVHTVDHNTGQKILQWCNSGAQYTESEIKDRIGACKSLKELLQLYYGQSAFMDTLKPAFEARKVELSKPLLFTLPKPSTNGKH